MKPGKKLPKYITDNADEARQVQQQIENHIESYAQDMWDEFAGRNGLTDRQVERLQEELHL